MNNVAELEEVEESESTNKVLEDWIGNNIYKIDFSRTEEGLEAVLERAIRRGIILKDKGELSNMDEYRELCDKFEVPISKLLFVQKNVEIFYVDWKDYLRRNKNL